MPNPFLYAWERGYDDNGMWSDELAEIALRNLRQSRVMETQAAENHMREQPFIDNQRSPAKKRPSEDGRSPKKRRQCLYKCKHCQSTEHSTRACPTVARKKPKTAPNIPAGARLYPPTLTRTLTLTLTLNPTLTLTLASIASTAARRLF